MGSFWLLAVVFVAGGIGLSGKAVGGVPTAKRVAVVTGAGQGIGQAIVAELIRSGIATDVACIEFTEDRCAETIALGRYLADTHSRHVPKLSAYAADVSNAESVANVAKQILSDFGQVDILVNNAGVTRDQVVSRMSDADWEFVLETNLDSVFYTCKNFVPQMMKRQWGRVVNMSSIVGVRGNAGQANYAASKAGAVGFTKALAREVAMRNITVNAVAPGYITTPMTRVLNKNRLDSVAASNPKKRFGTPEEVAAAVRFLASESASYVTGTVMGVDASQLI